MGDAEVQEPGMPRTARWHGGLGGLAQPLPPRPCAQAGQDTILSHPAQAQEGLRCPFPRRLSLPALQHFPAWEP